MTLLVCLFFKTQVVEEVDIGPTQLKPVEVSTTALNRVMT